MFDAVVLAGGSARRLGGVDKPGLQVAGISLLDRVLTASTAASSTVVVGPPRDTVRPVLWTQEEPPGGGPVAGLAAGISLVQGDQMLLLAADLPFLDQQAIDQLAAPLPAGCAGRVLTDGDRPQWLCGFWRTAVLRSALVGVEVTGARLRDVLSPLMPAQLSFTAAGAPAPWTDVDTEDDLRRARESA